MAPTRLAWLRAAALFACIAALQWPFLLADADAGLGWSRGPYTDEALYTVQARNALATGRLDLAETDGFIKEPLFAGALWGVQATVGDTMGRVRAAVMLACAAVLAALTVSAGGFGRTVRWAVPLAFLSYLPFHYGHVAMAEVPCSVAVLVGLALLHRRLQGGGWGWLLGASVAMMGAYALKIQFAYAAVIPPLACVMALLLRWMGRLPLQRRHATDVLLASAYAIGCAGLFAVVWVLPHRELFAAIVGGQAAERTTGTVPLLQMVLDNLRQIRHQQGLWPLGIVFALGAAAAVRGWRASQADAARRSEWIVLMAPAWAWCLIEAHKLLLGYLPSRYYVSTMLALAVAGCAGIATLGPWRAAAGSRAWRVAMPLVLAVVLLGNATYYVRSIEQRRYALHEAQRALAAEGVWHGKTVVGPWAPALFWGTGAIAKPVWHQAFNDRDIVARLSPSAIVTEPDQADSHRAFALDGVSLPAAPDHQVRVHAFDVQVYRWPPAAPALATTR